MAILALYSIWSTVLLQKPQLPLKASFWTCVSKASSPWAKGTTVKPGAISPRCSDSFRHSISEYARTWENPRPSKSLPWVEPAGRHTWATRAFQPAQHFRARLSMVFSSGTSWNAGSTTICSTARPIGGSRWTRQNPLIRPPSSSSQQLCSASTQGWRSTSRNVWRPRLWLWCDQSFCDSTKSTRSGKRV